jgi:hypothetical protein
MPANTAKIQVGRLLEIRADAGYRTRGDVDALFDMMERELGKLSGNQRHVTVVDWRRCPVMAPEAAEHIATRIAATNATTERSAALAKQDAPVAVLQFVRVIREARLPDRKLFFEERELIGWLKETLTGAELVRLRAFLSEGRGA